ncbi:hypothetical protein [Deinococcus cavernae]|nr:hypothetical protein [Deinococcus cavernae]
MRLLKSWKVLAFVLLTLGLSACSGPQPVCDQGQMYDPAGNTCVADQ